MSPQPQVQPATFAPRGPLRGTARVPGDKSISHRALMLAAMARGRSRITGLSEGGDVLATARALRAMGVRIEREDDAWAVDGVGAGGLLQPREPLDMGNSGTSARLLMGLVASHPIHAAFTGDASLSRRPMDRVIEPLRCFGADIASTTGCLPLILKGACPAIPGTFQLEIASAQVKSALLLAALNTPGETRIIEPVATRDHSERMLRQFGADLETAAGVITLRGEAELAPQRIEIPGDISSAAFLLVAALIVPGSEIRIEGVGINAMRLGLIQTLQRMGADLRIENERALGGEPVADLTARHSPLRAVDVPREAVPSMIDEFPIFFVAAAFAEGTTSAHGLAELRVKESDRIAAMAAGLRRIGVEVEEDGDDVSILGSAGDPLPGDAAIDPRLDHRIAMSFAVAGLHARQPVTVADMTPVATSFPAFAAALDGLLSE